MVNQSAHNITTFDDQEVAAIRQRLSSAWMEHLSEDTPEGWSKSQIDLTSLVAAAEPLRLKDGFVLRAYQYSERNDGSGVVWAMRADLPFPEPEDCPETRLPRYAWALQSVPELEPPRPPSALDDPMEAIEGDGSPRSYLCASLLARELAEFGAVGHGSYWSAFHILGSDSWSGATGGANASPIDGPTGDLENWRWHEPKPQEWQPTVRMDDNMVAVTFYTFNGLGTQQITRHVDLYRAGQYTFANKEHTIATGPEGYIW